MWKGATVAKSNELAASTSIPKEVAREYIDSEGTSIRMGPESINAIGKHFLPGAKWHGVAFGHVHQFGFKVAAGKTQIQDVADAATHFSGPFAVDDISAMKEMWFTNNRKPEFNVVFKQEAIFPEGKPELFAAALMAVAQLAVKDFDDSVTKRWPDRNNNMTLKFPWMMAEKSKNQKRMAAAYASLRRCP